MGPKDDEEAPASVELTTESGEVIDINNISGKKRAELIKSGAISLNNLVSPDNTPGKKLAAIREAHKERFEKSLTKEDKEPNPYTTGDMISFEGEVYEVMKTDETRVMIKYKSKKKAGKLVDRWIFHTKVTKG